MNTLLIKHVMKNGNYVDAGFQADLESFKNANKVLDWDTILTKIYNGESYTTINQPYNNIEISLI